MKCRIPAVSNTWLFRRQSLWHRQRGGCSAFPPALTCRGRKTARVYRRLTASSCIPGPEPQALAKALPALSPSLSGRAGVGGNLVWGDGAFLQLYWTLEPTCSLPAKSGQCKLPFPAWDVGCLWGREMIFMWSKAKAHGGDAHITVTLTFSHGKSQKERGMHKPWERDWNVKHMLYGSSSHFW